MKNSQKLVNLSEKDFSFVCPMKIEDMKEISGGYFCNECEKKVHDVSHMTQEEYKQLVSKTENICVTFKKVATVSLALSLAACTSTQKSESVLLGELDTSCNTEQNKSQIQNPLSPYKGIDSNEVELGGEPLPIKGKIRLPENSKN